MSYLNVIKIKSVTGYRISRRQQLNWFWLRFKFLPLICNIPFFCFQSCFAFGNLNSPSFPSTFPSPKLDVNSLPSALSSGFCALSAPALLLWFHAELKALSCRSELLIICIPSFFLTHEEWLTGLSGQQKGSKQVRSDLQIPGEFLIPLCWKAAVLLVTLLSYVSVQLEPELFGSGARKQHLMAQFH